MTERIDVIGADAAGMSAASQAKRIAGDAVEIVAFERGAYSSYSACGIPYWVAGDVDGPERLVARSPDAHRRNGIDLRMRTEVEKIDLAAGRVLADLRNRELRRRCLHEPVGVHEGAVRQDAGVRRGARVRAV